jgi:hypothetical protein
MIRLLPRRGRSAAGVTVCESCGQVCTTRCLADARLDRVRTQALAFLPHIR